MGRLTLDPLLTDALPLRDAVQQQLGLKIAVRQEPREVLVIDHIVMPSPD